MEAEDVSFDDGSQGKVIEERGEVLPYAGISVFSKAFIVESINLSNLLGLVISSKDGDS